MSIIKTAAELTIPTTIKILIYGTYGSGKTTLGLSASKPIMFDFDDSARRLNERHQEQGAFVECRPDPTNNRKSWDEIMGLIERTPQELAPFDTIVVDTSGKMIDAIIYRCCGNRQPYVQEWRDINQEFKRFVKGVAMLGKNLVFIAHSSSKEIKKKKGSEQYFYPDIREKSYAAIATDFDLIGFLQMETDDSGRQVRSLTFDPTSHNDGKNTCEMPALDVPMVIQNGQEIAKNDFLQREVFSRFFAYQQGKVNRAKEYQDLLTEISEAVELITDEVGANEFMDKVIKDKNFKHVGTSLQKARELFAAKVKALALTYNKETQKYEKNA